MWTRRPRKTSEDRVVSSYERASLESPRAPARVRSRVAGGGAGVIVPEEIARLRNSGETTLPLEDGPAAGRISSRRVASKPSTAHIERSDGPPLSTRFKLSTEPTSSGRSIALLKFDRPPVNAIDEAAKVELMDYAAAIARDPSIGAMIIYGDKHFSVGDDINEMAAASPQYVAAGRELISPALSAIENLPFPVIAAVRGYALGGGCELALAADFRVTADNAIWGMPEIHLGLIPAGGGTQRLPRLVGSARAKRLVFLGEHVSGEEAAEWGLADQAVPTRELLTTARVLATDLCNRAPLALRAAKRALAAANHHEGGLELEAALFASLMQTSDAQTGLRSFVRDGRRGKAAFKGA